MDNTESASPRARRYVVIGLLLVATGIGMIASSFAYRDSHLFVATVMVSVGAGLLPTGTVVLLEPWLMRNVSRSARQIADMSAQQAVADVKSRLDALAQIQDIQSQADTQHESRTTNIAETLLANPSYETLWTLLQEAESRGILAHDAWIRDGSNTDHLVRFDVMENDLTSQGSLVPHIRITLGELRHDLVQSMSFEDWASTGRLYKDKRPGVVIRCWSRWNHDMTFQDAIVRFRDECAKVGLSALSMDWGTCLEHLVANYEKSSLSVAAGVRSQPLVLDINDEWCIVEPARLISKVNTESYTWDQLFRRPRRSETSSRLNDRSWQDALRYAECVMAPPAKPLDAAFGEQGHVPRSKDSQFEYLIARDKLTARQIAEALHGDLYRRDRTDLELLLRQKQLRTADLLLKNHVNDFISGVVRSWTTVAAYAVGSLVGAVTSNFLNRSERNRLRAKSIRALKEYYAQEFGDTERRRLDAYFKSTYHSKQYVVLGECWSIEATKNRKGRYGE
ncbi:MAG: hypothetical protein F4033_05790 [Acidimicrobiaceae bacterium]|nr:hypothetical protein [Acidimicrobiaceae bacterium]MYJ83689.1 hypothetical protein [Acidimicrobiaceae bacterium]